MCHQVVVLFQPHLWVSHRPESIGKIMTNEQVRLTSFTAGLTALAGTVIFLGIDPMALLAIAITSCGVYALASGIKDI